MIAKKIQKTAAAVQDAAAATSTTNAVTPASLKLKDAVSVFDRLFGLHDGLPKALKAYRDGNRNRGAADLAAYTADLASAWSAAAALASTPGADRVTLYLDEYPSVRGLASDPDTDKNGRLCVSAAALARDLTRTGASSAALAAAAKAWTRARKA